MHFGVCKIARDGAQRQNATQCCFANRQVGVPNNVFEQISLDRGKSKKAKKEEKKKLKKRH